MEPIRRRALPALCTLFLLLTAAACGAGDRAAPPEDAGTAAPRTLQLSLDWTPNPDHVGLYYAQEKGHFARANLSVQMRAPSDPSAPIKLVGLRQVDLAISYQPDLFFSAEQDLPVIAVGAVVPVPLNSLIALPDAGIRTAAALRDRKVGVTGIPTDEAILSTVLRDAGVRRDEVTSVNVGFNLVTSLLSRKVDAILGGYRNVEAIQLGQELGRPPVVLPVDQLGVPSYDELVVVANAERLRSDAGYADTVRRFLQALVEATTAAQADREGSVAVMRGVTTYEPEFLQASVPATLALMRPPSGKPVACMDRAAWQAYGDWMRRTGLLREAVDAGTVMTTEYLPHTC